MSYIILKTSVSICFSSEHGRESFAVRKMLIVVVKKVAVLWCIVYVNVVNDLARCKF